MEFYSNAIVAFMVIQGLTYCYTFGKNQNFNSVLKVNLSLSISLAALF